MWLAGLNILTNAIGGVLLFLWGSYFFSSTMALLFGGFSAIQAVTAGIAFLGMCNVSIHFLQSIQQLGHKYHITSVQLMSTCCHISV